MEYAQKRLDLRETDLFGWRGKVSGYVIDQYASDLKSGLVLPKVSVYQINPTTYQLIGRSVLMKGIEDSHVGGHSRAIAHFHANLPLEVLIVGNLNEINLKDFKPFNIRDVELVYDEWAKQDYKKRVGKPLRN